MAIEERRQGLEWGEVGGGGGAGGGGERCLGYLVELSGGIM